MIDSPIIDKSLKYLAAYLKDHKDDKRTYHNYRHSLSVANAVFDLAEKADFNTKETEDLVLAAIFHDIGYCTNPANHEAVGAVIADQYLITQGVGESRREKIKEYILATKVDWVGHNPMALYLRDADMYGLAYHDYPTLSEALRIELNHRHEKQISEEEWLDMNIEHFQKHSYHTKVGKKFFNKGKKKNLQQLLALKKEALKELKINTLSSSKAAQTQLKTSLRNHINLSAIADNKANIMLSINAIVITVGLPLMAAKIYDNQNFVYPIIALAASSIISMAYATLSTRPIKMNGITDMNKISQKQTNLFFFGNFYKMDFDTYESGIKQVVGDEEILENSITRDLFFLGKSLGTKFDYLRICYNVFLIGMILTAVIFIIVSSI